MKLRLTGKVLQTEDKSFGQGERKFSFKLAHVQTGLTSIDEVRFTDSWPGMIPRAGEVIDVQVEIGAFAGRSGVTLSATAVEPFDEAYALQQFEDAA